MSSSTLSADGNFDIGALAHPVGDYDPTNPSGNDVRFSPDVGGRASDGPTSSVSASGVGYIDGLLSGVKWSATTITFSFPDEASDYEGGYPDDAPLEGFGQLSASQQAILRAALDGNTWRSIDGFTNLQTTDNGIDPDSTLRAAYSTDPDPSAYAYYPSAHFTGGDMWFGTTSSYGYATAQLGSSGYRSTLHELGHALGLKHGHEVSGPANMAVPVEYNHHEYTVMPYISYQGGSTGGYTNAAGSHPQSFMMADIAALQYMYGANFGGTSSTYTWSATTGEMFVNGVGQGAPGGGAGGSLNKIFLTIWDNGGDNDVYDASNYTTGVSIDLRPGYFSVLSQTQLAYLGGGPNSGYARGNVYNALLYQDDLRSLVENAIGGSGNDSLVGNQGNNILDGRGGTDTLDGGAGNDTYVLADGFDTVIDSAGTDTITSTISRSLADYATIEKLTLLGTGHINGTGNALNNVIRGNGGDNILDGGAGKDGLIGGAGNDTYVLADGNDTVTDSKGLDKITTTITRSLLDYVGIENLTLLGSGHINGTGNDAANTIIGNSGNNILDGGLGKDILNGGAGNDTYVLANANDTVIDSAGIDTITSTITRSLVGYADIERLTLLGTGNINGTGNALNNVIKGNSGNNILDGGDGADGLDGGDGDDTYVLADGNDSVIDSGGVDTITSTITRTLEKYATIEKLTLLGTDHINGVGNGLNNVIRGNSGNNTLSGGAGDDGLIGGLGNDRLTGGIGKDSFVFNTALNAATNVDTITDFSVVDDTIQLDNAIFTRLGIEGRLSTSMLAINLTGEATDANDRIIYESDTGRLYYDANGSAAGAGVHFATLSPGLALTVNDFLII